MSIEYTYEIINVDVESKSMEVVYSSAGHQTIHVGTRLPYEGELVESIVQMYAPLSFWKEEKTPVVIPEVGVSGTITVIDPEDIAVELTSEEQLQNARMWAELKFEQDVAKTLVKFGIMETDPTAIPVSEL